MVVIDASAVVDLLLELPVNQRLLHRLEDASELHAPHLIDLEVLSVLRRLVRSATLGPDAASMARRSLAELPIERYPHVLLRDRIWELRDNLTIYDAAYVALAEELELPLVTSDGRLARSVGHHAVVESYIR